MPSRLHAGEGRTRGIIRARYAAAIRRVLANGFVRQSILVFGATMGANALNYVFHFIVARLLSVDDYGAVAPLLNAVQLLAIPAAIVTIIVAKYAAEFQSVDDRAKLRRLWTTCLLGSLGVGFLAFVIVVALRGRIAAYMQLPNGQEGAVVAMGALLFATLCAPAIRGTFQGQQRFRIYGFVIFIEAFVKVVLGVTFVKLGFGLAGAIWGCAAGLWLSDAIGIVLLVRSHDRAPERLRLDVRRLVVTMVGVGGSTVVITVLSFTDALLVKHYLSAQEAGLFAAITVIGKVPLFAVGFVPTLVLPRATTLAKSGKSPLPVLREAGVLMLLIAGAGLFGFGFFAKLAIIFTLGAKYLGAVPLLFTYVVAITFLGALSIVVAYKTGLHRFDFVVPIGLVAIAEIVVISFVHPSLEAVLRILAGGHALAFVVSLNGVFDGATTLRGAVEEQRGFGLRARFIRSRKAAVPSVEEAS